MKQIGGAQAPVPQTMTAADCRELLDALIRSVAPKAYARGVYGAFLAAGQEGDALVAAMIAKLHNSGEVELPMRLRAEWTGRGGIVQPSAPLSTYFRMGRPSAFIIPKTQFHMIRADRRDGKKLTFKSP